MKKIVYTLVAAVVMVGLVLAGAGPASAKTWTLKYHHEQPETAPYHKYGHKPWAEAVEKATKGKVKIEIYPMQTLVKTKDAWNAVTSGLADVIWGFSATQPGRFDLLDTLQLPFIVTNAKAGSRTAWALLNKFPELQALFHDVKLLSAWTTDPYMIVSRKPIKTIEDIKGQKIRAAGKPPSDMIRLLGGAPLYVPMPQTYVNLQKGVLDGACAPAEAFLGFRFYEVAKYVNLINTPANLHYLVMNKRLWGKMPPDIQEAIMSVSGEYAGVNFFGGGTFDKAAKGAQEVVKKAGYKVEFYTPPKEEVDRWIEKGGKPIWDKWVKDNSSKGPSQAIFDETVRLMKQFTE